MAQSGHVEASVRLSAFAAKRTWRRRKQEDAAHQHYEECGLKHAVMGSVPLCCSRVSVRRHARTLALIFPRHF